MTWILTISTASSRATRGNQRKREETIVSCKGRLDNALSEWTCAFRCGIVYYFVLVSDNTETHYRVSTSHLEADYFSTFSSLRFLHQ